MFNSDQLQDLLATDMDRREFLAYSGAVLLTILGISGLLRALTNPSSLGDHNRTSSAPGGYGSSTYGGKS